jgi:hypothetical protein
MALPKIKIEYSPMTENTLVGYVFASTRLTGLLVRYQYYYYVLDVQRHAMDRSIGRLPVTKNNKNITCIILVISAIVLDSRIKLD